MQNWLVCPGTLEPGRLRGSGGSQPLFSRPRERRNPLTIGDFVKRLYGSVHLSRASVTTVQEAGCSSIH